MIKNLISVMLFVLFSCMQGQEIELFDEKRAFGYLEAQCSFGPRVPGTSGHRKGLNHILETVARLFPILILILVDYSHSLM